MADREFEDVIAGGQSAFGGPGVRRCNDPRSQAPPGNAMPARLRLVQFAMALRTFLPSYFVLRTFLLSTAHRQLFFFVFFVAFVVKSRFQALPGNAKLGCHCRLARQCVSAHCPPPTVHRPLPTAHCPPPTVHRPPFFLQPSDSSLRTEITKIPHPSRKYD